MIIANTFQTPNSIVDRYMAFLTEAELRVLLYTIRRIYGFGKEVDRISLTQYTSGIVTNSGKRLDYGCGIANRKTVSRALKSLTELGFLEQVAPNDKYKNEGATWTIQVGEDYEHDKVNFSALLERAGARSKENRKRTVKAREIMAEKQKEKEEENPDPGSGTTQVDPGSRTTQPWVVGLPNPQVVGLPTPGLSDYPPLGSGTTPQNPVLNPDRNPEETQIEKASAQKPDFKAMDPKEVYELPEIKLYIEIAERKPAEDQWETIWELMSTHRFTKEYLKPFWDEMKIMRGWGRPNLAWLEWAAQGEIPGKGYPGENSQNGNRSKPRGSGPQRRDPTPEELERGRAAARQRKLDIEARLQGVR